MLLKKIALAASTLLLAGITHAAPVSYWVDNGFSQIGDDEGVAGNGFVNPGWGGQDFDAEYMFYKIEGTQLHIGLQTGFDVSTGHINYNGRDYYAGDIALSFDGDTSNYEYAIDFGLFTQGYTGGPIDAGSGTGIDAAGLYSVSSWNNDIYFDQSAPYAMDAGTLEASLLSNDTGLIGESYYQTASFDLTLLGLTGDLELDSHWTMSCGNDYVNGHTDLTVPVSEPATLPLLAFGTLLMLMGQRRRLKA